MKKIILILTILCTVYSITTAQTTTTTTDSRSTSGKGLTKKGKPDMRLKANKVAVETKQTTTVQSTTTQSTGLNKNGTPDMRLKANKHKTGPAASAKTQSTISNNNAPVVAPATPRGATTQTSNRVTTTDKVISTDDKGRTIYEGPRGGHYYINKNGHKEYIKK